MKPCRLISLLILSAVVVVPRLSSVAGAEKLACEVAKPRKMPDGAPQASDVIMRSMRLRMAKGKNPHDTFQALADFHVTRLEWAYIRDEEFIKQVRESGRLFGGAASSALAHVAKTSKATDYSKLACVNLNGEPVIPTWKRAWRPPGNFWICVNNPATESCYLEYLQACLDAGAEIMQRDEPSGNENAINWGGCFCDCCVRAFRDYLAGNTTAEQQKQLGIDDVGTFDYRDLLKRKSAPVGDDFRRWDGGELKRLFVRFQTEATVAFHNRTRGALNEYAGRRVAISCNNGCRNWTPTQLAFDWCFGELSYRHARPDFIHDAMLEATKHGRCQVVTMPKKSNRDHLDAWCLLARQTIATAYACGGHCMVPWDVYMPSDAPRYFGMPEQYADLYGFLRAAGKYLDGYEYAGAFGSGITCKLYDDEPPARTPDGSRVLTVVRAVPDRPDEAVVVHLIDWSENPRPFNVTLNPAALFGDRAIKTKLLVPVPYDRTVHEKAEKTRAYGALHRTVPLENGYVATVTVPALKPWGLLVIEPDATHADGVWSPTIRPVDRARYRETLTVRLSTASSGASVHYTTDGRQPTTASPRYEKPISLTGSATVKAVAVLPDGRTSRVTSTSFEKLADAPRVTSPDSAALKANLKLWLKADALAQPDGSPVKTWTAAVGPDAVAQPHKTFDGTVTGPPAFKTDAIRGRPAVRFDGVDDSLTVSGFSNRCLAGRGFTILMVTQSEANGFGMCGNGIWGTGGIPRLYLQRGAFRYHGLRNVVNLRPPGRNATISAFMHDGRETMSAAGDGVLSESVSGVPVVPKFGGGNLTIPFWSGNKNCPGDMAEIVVFDRKLSDSERVGVEAYLADKYAIKYARRWD